MRVAIPPQDVPLVDPATGLTNIDWYDKLLLLTRQTPKIVTFTRALSLAAGAQSIAGVGFTPSYITFMVGLVGGSLWGSTGQSDGIAATCLEINPGTTVYYQTGFAGILRDNSSNYQYFTVNSFDPDGFTIGWTKFGVPAATASISATCFR